MTPMEPDVTFVIAAYNAEGFIEDAIESALSQRSVRTEVIVADDKSTDRTVEVANSYADRGVSVIALTENRGPAGARNAAVARAKGRWLAVLDSDDMLLPDRSARMIALADRTGAEIVVDNVEVAGADGRTGTMFSRQELAALQSLDLATFILSNRVFRATHNFGYMKPMLRRDFIAAHDLSYNENLRIGEDYVFLASALARGARCAVDPDTGYVYRVRSGSISEVLDLGHVRMMQQADIAFERAHGLDPNARAALRKRKRNLSQAAAYLALVDHIKNRAVADALSTAIANPMALHLLKMPIGVRLRRLATHFPTLRLV